jgi:hypothetical protein
MQSFCDAFRRNADGSWQCIAPATLRGPGIRIDASPGDVYQRGITANGLDLAEFLDVEEALRLEAAACVARRRSRQARQRPQPGSALLAD